MASSSTIKNQAKYGATVCTRLGPVDITLLDAKRRSLTRSQYIRMLVQRDLKGPE